jgi:hypothetical protein
VTSGIDLALLAAVLEVVPNVTLLYGFLGF